MMLSLLLVFSVKTEKRLSYPVAKHQQYVIAGAIIKVVDMAAVAVICLGIKNARMISEPVNRGWRRWHTSLSFRTAKINIISHCAKYQSKKMAQSISAPSPRELAINRDVSKK